jgi:hypothetical protein
MLLMWPREKACRNVRQRAREAVRSIPSNGQVGMVIQKLNPILNGWCTYFRVGHSNRMFHKIDWAVLSDLQLWLRRKHQRSWRSVRIPEQVEHSFRSKLNTDSDPSRTPIPIEAEHSFRSKLNADSSRS